MIEWDVFVLKLSCHRWSCEGSAMSEPCFSNGSECPSIAHKGPGMTAMHDLKKRAMIPDEQLDRVTLAPLHTLKASTSLAYPFRTHHPKRSSQHPHTSPHPSANAHNVRSPRTRSP